MSDWSSIEVDATIASYFAMLDMELRGTEYNKASHRRALVPLLNGRSEASIEFKHRNISAVLLTLGSPYIAGYKPAFNFQRLLFDRVQERLDEQRALVRTIESSATEPVTLPSVDDILDTLVTPPRADERARLYEVRERPVVPRVRNYLEIEARNRFTGSAGEEFVTRFEVARLLAARRDDLAARVERVSVTRGDGDGFDILSFEADARERFIEVKATRYGEYTPFFVTRNELYASERRGLSYYLYRVFDLGRRPRLFHLAGSLGESFVLEPNQYVARVK